MKKIWAFLMILAALLAVGFTKQKSQVEQPLDWEEISAFITLEDAKRMTNDFTYTYEGVRSQHFSAAPVRELLDQGGVMGVRIYYARYPDTEKTTLVLVGVDEFGQDQREGLILNFPIICPPICSEDFAVADLKNAGKTIMLAQAKDQTVNFQLTRDGVRAHLFSASKIRSILDQEGTVGLQIYYGEQDGPQLVLLGLDENGENQTEGLILDIAKLCPHCAQSLISLWQAENQEFQPWE